MLFLPMPPFSSLEYTYLFGVKEDGHPVLFTQFKCFDKEGSVKTYTINSLNKKQVSKYCNGLFLNNSNRDINTNMLYYEEYDKKTGQRKVFSWITPLFLSEQTVEKVMKAGRSRWKIENETFNTLKNQDYNFEHNYGHGNNNLCTILMCLMFLVFFLQPNYGK